MVSKVCSFVFLILFIVGAIYISENKLFLDYFSQPVRVPEQLSVSIGLSDQQKVFFENFYDFWRNDFSGREQTRYSPWMRAKYIIVTSLGVSVTVISLVSLLVFFSRLVKATQKRR